MQKMKKQLGKGLVLAVLLMIPAFVLFSGKPAGVVAAANRWDIPVWDTVLSGSFAQSLEKYVRDNIPGREFLRSVGIGLRYWGGSREEHGILIGTNQLINNIDPPVDSTVERNLAAVTRFAEYLRDMNKPFYFTLIPTASGVLQQLPRNVQVFDQRHFIEDVYGQLTGKANVVNTHLPLKTNRAQYIYYRTEDNLTAHGGYYVYAALAKRMGLTENPSYNNFHIEYNPPLFEGDLYQASPYGNVEADVLMWFRYSRAARRYTVTHKGPEGTKTYDTLYPPPDQGKAPDMTSYLGGISAVVEIETNANVTRKLLVFGDKTALAYLPLLVNHYRQVTFVDLFYDTDSYAAIDPEEYDQVLVAYSVESFISPPNTLARITQFMMDE